MKTVIELEKRFGSVEFGGKKYILCDQAEMTNRLLDIRPNYNEPDDDGSYYFEMSAPAIDENEAEYTVYWIFLNDDGEKELDTYDYSKINRVVSI